MNIDYPNILLTGGSGFLGQAIVNELLDEDSPFTFGTLRIFDLADNSGRTDPHIQYFHGDIRNPDEISEACRGMDIVLHTAAVVDWGTKPAKEVYDTNVTGTRNVISACRKEKAGILVYTSSLDAVFAGKPLVSIDENQPYPKNHPNMYCLSKCLAEQQVLKASLEGLKCCVLRPADIYGEGDPFHIGSLIGMAKEGIYIRIGNGTARSQHVYVGNIACAELQAAYALWGGNKDIIGNVYFITDGPASNFFTFYDRIVSQSGYRIWPENLRIPAGLAYLIGSINEGIAFLIRPVKRYTPKFTRFAVLYTCSDFTFTAEKARNDFGFIPKYSAEECFERTVKFYRASV